MSDAPRMPIDSQLTDKAAAPEVWLIVRALEICEDDGEFPGLSFDFRHGQVFKSEAEAVAYMDEHELPLDFYAHPFVAGERTEPMPLETIAAQSGADESDAPS